MKKIIYFNGMPGSGKLTMAKMVAQKIDARVIDNHKFNNLLFDIKSFNEEVPKFVWESIRNIKREIFGLLEVLPQDNDYIFTGITTKFKENMSFNGVKDLAEKLDSDFYLINLVCDESELLKRIDTTSRKENKKITCKKLYQELIDVKSLKLMNVS
ncbi:MAG TPA: hypothetical protein DCL21_04425, partial [Alphaproteobacteria bacterium]|nr:hypothetical protein [Alphaproteobacteria bacterium]